MKSANSNLVALVLIVLGAALAYLPLVSRFGYSYDDWYLMYSAKAYGPQAFHAIFSIDRPLRAYLMIPAYMLFGEKALWYNLSAYLVRCLGGLAFWWLLKMLWPHARVADLAAALLFTIYPGFLSQPNAIDYQSHIVALSAAILSLALTVRFFLAQRLPEKLLWLGAAILTGWIYLGLMEYYIGFELIRFMLLLLLAARTRLDWMQRLRQMLGWLPLAAIALGFLFWRLYIFVGERKATDVDVQLGAFRAAPVQTAIQWSMGLLQNVWEVMFSAWFVPLRQFLPRMDLWQTLLGCGLGLLLVALSTALLSRLNDGDDSWHKEAILLGIGALFAGMIPVVLANRDVSFPYYSRYTLISSTGAALVWIVLIFIIPRKWPRYVLLSGLLFLAVLTHFANSVVYAKEAASMNAFWWQVSWRIPDMERGTTLIAHYPLVSAQEDYFIWGPANLIYYPDKVVPDVIQPGVFAAIPDDATVGKVLARVRQVYYTRRNIVTYANYRNLLILTQPSLDSCVQVIDGSQPEISSSETQRFAKMAPFSETEHILVNEPSHLPPAVVFGSEPAKGWCFYYEKAALARQRQDWPGVLRLADEANSKGLHPRDQIEWLPFLQGYAISGNIERLTAIAGQVTDPAVRKQACQILGDMNQLTPEIRAESGKLFCETD